MRTEHCQKLGHDQILYDGDDTDVVAHLRALRCVTLFFVRPPFASALEVQEMWAFDELHWQWGGCVLQVSLHVQLGISCQDSWLIPLARTAYDSQVLFICAGSLGTTGSW